MQKITIKEAIQVYTAVGQTLQLIRDSEGNITEALSSGFESLRYECATNIQRLYEMAQSEAEQQGKTMDEVIADIGDNEFPHIMPTLTYDQLPTKVVPGIAEYLKPVMTNSDVSEETLKSLFNTESEE